jgi:transposase
MSQITVFSGPERRRRWSSEERFQILTEAFSPGGCVSEVARRYDVSTGLIYTWRRKLRRELPGPTFAEAMVADEPKLGAAPASAAIVIELPGGGRVSIASSAPVGLAAAALKALR